MSTYSVAWPADEGQLLSYIEALQRSGCGPATMNRVKHVEKVGDVPEVEQMSKSVESSPCIRGYAWYALLQVWAGLRHSDLMSTVFH
eukprot:2845858-Amphidinium_carterae.3